MQQMRRIVLSGSEYIPEIEQFLMYRHPNVGPERLQVMLADILNGIVERIREQSMAMPNVVAFCHSISDNLMVTSQFPIEYKQKLLRLIRDLAMSLLYQATEWNLYDKRGLLMYSFYRVLDAGFKDVALSSILQLTWNRGYYEPIL